MLDDVEFLSFKDWIELKEYSRRDWVTVARSERCGSREMWLTFSALIPNSEDDAKKILQSSQLDIDIEFGYPYFKLESTGLITLELGDRVVSNDVEIESFTIYRDFQNAFPSRFEIVQSFILYHRLYYDSGQQKFINPLTEDIVIDYVKPEHVRIKASYLKDYLAARKMMLVRFHDHLRYVDMDVMQLLGKNSDTFIFKNNDFHYVVYIGRDELGRTFSNLRGKDIVRPFCEPSHEEYLYLAGKGKKRFVKFIIDITEGGEYVESTCNEEELSNNFENRGTPHYLTPVFFRKEVLQKYYNNPRKYSVSSGGVSFLDRWRIPFGINKEGLTHVWLGDLGRIPYEEQLHWRQYNVPPSGGINEQFYKSQLLAEFVETDDPIYRLHKARKQLNEKTEKKFGFKLFKELTPEDEYIEKSIHIPTANEQKEVDDQLIYLTKYLVDAIDRTQLKKRVSWSPSKPEEDVPTRFLQEFLVEKIGLSQICAEQLVNTLRDLQFLRSKSAAHLKPTEYQEMLRKLERRWGMSGLTQSQIFERLVRLVTYSLEKMAEKINSIPD